MARELDADVVISEIGGTVGDIESLPFLEAIRQLRADLGRDNVMYVHVTLVPYLRVANEFKTKPTQHSVKELRSLGIQPDVIVCRTEKPFPKEMEEKLALFCDIDKDAVIQAVDAFSIYEVPLQMELEGLDDIAVQRLSLQCGETDMTEWNNMVGSMKNLKKSTTYCTGPQCIALPLCLFLCPRTPRIRRYVG